MSKLRVSRFRRLCDETQQPRLRLGQRITGCLLRSRQESRSLGGTSLVVLLERKVVVEGNLLANRHNSAGDRRDFRCIGRAIPPLVSRFGSSLRTKTRAPTGST